MNIESLAKQTKKASRQLALISGIEKNKALAAMAEALRTYESDILEANAKDMAAGQEEGLSEALLDRLALNAARIEGMAKGLDDIQTMPDPIGQIDETWRTESGLEIAKLRVPLGVIAMIYEARPNVTVDAAGLCLKSGNAVILRGSRNALHSNQALVRIMKDALQSIGFPDDVIALVEATDHESVTRLLSLYDDIDLAIPRGGAGLIRAVRETSVVPVIATGTGNCHLYVDEAGDLVKAQAILINGKCQRPGVCNALETLLVHEKVAAAFLPDALRALQMEGTEIRGCEITQDFGENILLATEEDYATEFHDRIIAVRVVPDFEAAVEHIHTYSSGHSEVMISENYTTIRRFRQEIDAACVYINASSRFSDGAEFGFGAEIGISTQKMHARGPMGMMALTSYKYIIMGEGQIRQ